MKKISSSQNLRSWFIVTCAFFSTNAICAQPNPLDTLFAPTPCSSCGFAFDLDVASDPQVFDDGQTRLAVLEVGRQPDHANYVFRYDTIAERWLPEDSLGHATPQGGNVGEPRLFPSVDGSVATVGDAGDITVWRRNQALGTWEVEAFLDGIQKPGNGSACFGCAHTGLLFSSGEELIFVGAQNGGDDPSGGSREGSAYAFVRPQGVPPGPNAWQMEARILAPDGLEGDEFGASVALLPAPFTVPGGGQAGDALALIGARQHPRTGARDGAVYAYVRDGATGIWTVEEELTAPDASPTDGDLAEFGDEVAVIPLPGGSAGEALLYVGAPDHGICGAINGGSSYVYRREVDVSAPTGFSWTFETRLCPTDPRFEGRWGGSVDLRVVGPGEGDLEGTVLAIAGQTFDPGPDIPPGASDLYVRSTTGVWSHRARYETGADGVAFDAFGYSVALVGPGPGGPLVGQALVGAFLSDLAAPSAGAVFIYDSSVGTANEPEAPEVSATLSVHPNPVRGEATIGLTLVRSGYVRIVVYDVLGREVARIFEGELPGGVSAFSFPTARLPAAVYLVRVEGDTNLSVACRLTVVR